MAAEEPDTFQQGRAHVVGEKTHEPAEHAVQCV
jgi:hypothetical protein